ncbi:Eco57I restriction-modification methylase domain-containing protein [Fibrella sp. HMF5335]|uniref:site-specific DNA-methyltransferase (adenine-specific) n=1 Tax=Fibrella rubiginis TaxID=2817060 RepID=A0A939GI59_9BACT|nr:TaqI-like C-terminal specificity domain-containing protein [Fibrella rubiginis]MBO0937910.1 Eco57I restriction-modification methylase domain-containing protein [Fibrella rubiginis]
MQLTPITPTQSLEKAYRLQPGNREQIDRFRHGYIKLMGLINEKESEENVKGHLMDFLKEVYYNGTALGEAYIVAPKGKTDFVIHNGKDATTPAGVLFEVKRPANKGEMITLHNLNAKAFHELLLYYFRERLDAHNNDIRYCVITNVYEWFIFDAADIDRLFFRNAHLIKEYRDWAGGRKVSKNNELFYSEIIKPFLADLEEEIRFAHFDLRSFETIVTDGNMANDKALLPLYKVLSPTHLLKLPTATDSNRLNPKFYAELLHLIGLEEVKDGGKKVIRRKESGKRDEGSLLENTILELDSSGKFNRLTDRGQYGTTTDEQVFNVALELCITWVNRVLFLKLLESQVVTYHNDNKAFAFLNHATIPDFDELNKLFFRVLAKKPSDRQASIQAKFGRVPYLNSSLFELTDLENDTVSINQLDNSLHLPLLRNSVLLENSAYRNGKAVPTLAYLFAFLEAYDFTSESREVLQEKNRTLINASVLGLIFEKINGYKDGSFYTPGFITEYMCRETIRKAVVQKFNEAKGWNCADFAALENKDLDRAEANALINDIRICDPAVGSGHFLVSALNELIAVKSDLGVLQDATGKRIKDYTVSILNDELILQDEDETPFQYVLGSTDKPTPERQRVQKTLFHEKQTIIENCLFGVDINPNSVKICRLRLWIELLKNAYYTDESGFSELETLPNIDINIKQGNSLLSKFSLTEDLSDVFKKQRFTLRTYKDAVAAYKEAKTKEAKADLQQFINEIKSQFRETVYNRDPRRKRIATLRGQRILLDNNIDVFGTAIKDPKLVEVEKKRLDKLIDQIEGEIADIENNALYRGSFEWRFEFPEVLNDKGDFIGFDAIIGNPPYLVLIKSTHGKQMVDLMIKYYTTAEYNPNLYSLFVELSLGKLSRKNGIVSLIIPNSWLNGRYFTNLRGYLSMYKNLELINLKDEAFDVIVETVILTTKNSTEKELPNLKEYLGNNNFRDIDRLWDWGKNPFENNASTLVTDILSRESKIRDQCIVYRGVETRDNAKWLSTVKEDDQWLPILLGRDVNKYTYAHSGTYVKFLPKELKSNANIDLYKRKKILMRRTGNSIIACSDDNMLIALKNLYLIIPHQEKYISLFLAQLNSKLFDYIHKSLTTGENKAFAQFPAHYVESFPLKVSDSYALSIETIVMKIEHTKTVDPTADTSALETEIDRLVYGLYGLTDAEIAIVEGRA